MIICIYLVMIWLCFGYGPGLFAESACAMARCNTLPLGHTSRTAATGSYLSYRCHWVTRARVMCLQVTQRFRTDQVVIDWRTD